ncbi:hypothetical protein DVH24_035671 [Malus domestica]|uniref:Uncharacterized protein n=1 Tax=Malus domestica TaxID=3750 RepID=A0A498JSW6_MALDO|nr:hypothetical protein DVH24_035671 [Malus domestica]
MSFTKRQNNLNCNIPHRSGEWILYALYTLWELICFEFYRNSEVKRVRARAIPGWVTHWEVLV